MSKLYNCTNKKLKENVSNLVTCNLLQCNITFIHKLSNSFEANASFELEPLNFFYFTKALTLPRRY